MRRSPPLRQLSHRASSEPGFGGNSCARADAALTAAASLAVEKSQPPLELLGVDLSACKALAKDVIRG